MKYLKTINELRKMRPNNRLLEVDKLQKNLDIVTKHRDLIDITFEETGDMISYFKIDIKFDANKPEHEMSNKETEIYESLKWFNKNGLFDSKDSNIIFKIGKSEDFISTYEKPDDKIFYTSIIHGLYFPNHVDINKILKKYVNDTNT